MKIHKPISFNFRSLFFIITILSLFLPIFSVTNPVSASEYSMADPTNYNLRFDGEAVDDYFGARVSSAGDVNHDGYDDTLIGVKNNDTAGSNAGRVYIFLGGPLIDTIADVVFTGETAGDYLGCSVSSAGDVNNDGFDDVIVGAYSNDAGGLGSGRAYIFYGGSAMDSIEDVILTGVAAGDSFGYSVSAAGDVNHDYYDDVIIGAVGNDVGGSSAGAAYIFYGGLSMDSIADVMLIGATASDGFGNSVSSAGNVNNDDYDDVIVGARFNSAGGSWAGRAYIFFGGSPMNTTVDVTFTGAAADDLFGYGVSSASDVNHDNYDDVIVGAPGNDIGGGSAGAAYIFFGDLSMNSTADVTLTGVANSENFGNNVTLAGDVNYDGYSDVAVGSPTNEGRTNIFFGGSPMNTTSDIKFVGGAASDSLGQIFSAGDVNGDGRLDIIVGAYLADNHGSNSGSAYLIYNFPHTFSLDSVPSFNNYTPQIITGSISATESISPIVMVQYSVDDNSFSGDWQDCSADDGTFDSKEEDYTCNISTLSDGEHTIYIRAYDENISYTAQERYGETTFTVDTTSPTGTISINSDETITNTDEVTLTLSAIDNLTEVSKMMVSNKVDYSGGTWETYNTSKEWRLSMGDGEKKVYVKYRDEVGNISSSYSDSIEMDMGAPTGTLIINEGEEYTSSREVVLHITGEDEVTGVEEMRISEDRTMEGVEWEGYTTSREYTLSEGDGYKVIYIQYRDGIGNESEVYGSNITLDRNTEIEVTEIGEEEVEGEIVNWETKETNPTLIGEGEVGATITIEIEGIETGTVIVNADGVWSWTPSIELTRGQEYNVTITSTDLAGNEDIQTFILGISDEEVINVNQTTPETQETATQLPNTGTILIISLMLLGGLIWSGYNLKVIEKLRK